MKVKIHKLFEYLLETTSEAPEAVLGYSLSQSPRLGDFLDDLDPELSLDWNNRSFLGLPELRTHVLRQARLSDVLEIKSVLITAGTAEANYLAIMQLVQPGDEVITDSPGWPQLRVITEALGVQTHSVNRSESAGWALPIDALAAKISPKTKLIFLTNPNNPTGRLLSRDELKEIAGLAGRVGAYVLVDEVYAGLEWDGERVASIAGLYERGITTGSVSKALGLQGLRTGWLVSPDKDLIMDAVILRENSSEIMNIMGEAIAEIALRPDRYEQAMSAARSEGRANLALLDSFVADELLLEWQKPQAGLIGLARLGGGLLGDDVAKALLAAPYRTFLIPGSAYDQKTHIRLGVGGGEAVNLPLGLERLSACLKALAPA